MDPVFFHNTLYTSSFDVNVVNGIMEAAVSTGSNPYDSLRYYWQQNPHNANHGLPMPELTVSGFHLLQPPHKRPIEVGILVALQANAVFLFLNDELGWKVVPYRSLLLRREKSPTPSGEWNEFMAIAYGDPSSMNFAKFQEQRDGDDKLCLLTFMAFAEDPFYVMLEVDMWREVLAFFDAFLPDPRVVPQI